MRSKPLCTRDRSLITWQQSCTHFGGKKNTTAPPAVRCGFWFCFQAKEEIKLSKMDENSSAQADGGGMLHPRVRQNAAPSRVPAPSQAIQSRSPAEPQPSETHTNKTEFQLKRSPKYKKHAVLSNRLRPN